VSTFELARLLPGVSLIGLDIAPRMLAQARRRAGQCAVQWLLADAVRLPLRDASVDACTGHSFLYLVRNRAAVLAEARRVLKPGGRLVLMEPHARRASLRAVLAVSRDPRHLVSVSLWRPFSRLHGRFTPCSLTATLGQAGFVDCRIEETLGGLGLLASARRP
jgi:SAM-dependent methyltransferase